VNSLPTASAETHARPRQKQTLHKQSSTSHTYTDIYTHTHAEHRSLQTASPLHGVFPILSHNAANQHNHVHQAFMFQLSLALLKKFYGKHRPCNGEV